MNPATSAFLSQVTARPIRAVLQDLLQQHRKDPSIPRPAVTLFLHSGLSFTGQVVDLEIGNQQSTVVVYVPQKPAASSEQPLVYLDLAAVAALRLDDLSSVPARQVAVAGKPLSLVSGEAVSRLAYLRYLTEQQPAFSGFALEADPLFSEKTDNFAAVKLQTEKVVAILKELLNDALGREALENKVKRVFFTPGDAARARLSGADLVMELQADPALSYLPGLPEIRAMIEGVL